MSKPLQYVLGRGLSASTRLNFQHAILRNQLGYLLHRDVKLPRSPSVADIGTGTGIWPVDVIKTMSVKSEGGQFVGFDVSKDQFPNPNLFPKEVVLRQQDAFSAYPESFVGKFDMVNVRFFVSILNEANIGSFMRGVSSLLRPGGFLQWVDINPANTAIAFVGRDPEPTPGNIQYAVDQYKALNGAQVISQLDKYTQGHGLELVAHETTRITGFELSLWFQNEVMALEDYYVQPAKASGDPKRIEKAEQAVASFIEEAQTGAYISPEIFTRVMRKVK